MSTNRDDEEPIYENIGPDSKVIKEPIYQNIGPNGKVIKEPIYVNIDDIYNNISSENPNLPPPLPPRPDFNKVQVDEFGLPIINTSAPTVKAALKEEDFLNNIISGKDQIKLKALNEDYKKIIGLRNEQAQASSKYYRNMLDKLDSLTREKRTILDKIDKLVDHKNKTNSKEYRKLTGSTISNTQEKVLNTMIKEELGKIKLLDASIQKQQGIIKETNKHTDKELKSLDKEIEKIAISRAKLLQPYAKKMVQQRVNNNLSDTFNATVDRTMEKLGVSSLSRDIVDKFVEKKLKETEKQLALKQKLNNIKKVFGLRSKPKIQSFENPLHNTKYRPIKNNQDRTR